jgi:hypothetical protein
MGLAAPRWEAFAQRGAHGVWTLPQWLDLPYGVVLAGVVALALLAFVAAEWIERRAA